MTLTKVWEWNLWRMNKLCSTECIFCYFLYAYIQHKVHLTAFGLNQDYCHYVNNKPLTIKSLSLTIYILFPMLFCLLTIFTLL